jgi:hypothetical protein
MGDGMFGLWNSKKSRLVFDPNVLGNRFPNR